MKYDLEVTYAGQTHVFTNLEHDDEALVGEDYLPRKTECVEENNGRIVDNFYENMILEIIRHE